jgi:hypothetical protein
MEGNNMGRLGPIVDDIVTAASSTTIAVATSDNLTAVYTMSKKFIHATDMAVHLDAASDSVAVKVELEQGLTPPTTEGSADDAWVKNTTVIDANLNVTTPNQYVLSPKSFPYWRLKITGLTGNDASTTLRGYYGRQEDV